jgi:hypothetical protein
MNRVLAPLSRQPRILRRSFCLAACVVALIWVGIRPVPSAVPGAAAATRQAQAAPATQRERPAALAHKTSSVRIYLIAIADNGRSGKRIGCGDSVIAVTRPIVPTTTPLKAALRLLLSNHQAHYGRSGLYNALYQATLRLQTAAVTNGKAVVHLTGRLNLRGVCDDPRADAQLRETVRQFPTVHNVAIYINNVPLWKVLSQK